MKRIFFNVLLFLFIFSCASTAENKKVTSEKEIFNEEDAPTIIVNVVIKNVNKLPNKTVAVVDFSDIDGKELEEGKILAEQIITKLSQMEGIKVIARKQLNKILKEQELSMKGISESDDQSIGKILNVDAIISGTIICSDECEEVNARMIDVKTGEIYCSASSKKRLRAGKKEFAQLSQEQEERLRKAHELRDKERKENPEFFKMREKHKLGLLRLKQKNPELFKKVIKTLKIVDRLKVNRPRAFLLVTEPPNSPHLKRFRRNKPKEFKRVQKLRRGIEFIIKHSPEYKKKLMFERRMILGKLRK